MLSRTLKMAFWVCYDHLGKLIVVNLFSMLVLAAPGMVTWTAVASGDAAVVAWIGLPALFLMTGVLGPALAAGLAHMAKELIETRDGSVRTFFRGLRQFGLRAVGVGLCYSLAASCLAVSTWFYATRLGTAMPWLGYLLSAVALWCLIGLGLSALLAMPALVQKRAGGGGTLKLSGLLMLDNPWFCIGLTLHVGMLGVFAVVPPILMLFSIAPAVVLVTSGYEMLSRKYAAAATQEALATGPLRPAVVFNDAEDDYLNRGFRDFLFPWKG